MTRPMPMFPLQSVLVPAAPLPLHVFEDRYRAMMEVVMKRDPPEFGVVLIERGSDVGGGDVRTNVGTVARIIDAERTLDGRWGVVALGTRRIDVTEWFLDDPYPVARVADRPDVPWSAAAGELVEGTERVVRSALALKSELGDPAPAATVELAPEPVTRAWQLVAIAPVAILDRHHLLSIDEPAERLRTLRELVEEEAAVLAHRLQGL